MNRVFSRTIRAGIRLWPVAGLIPLLGLPVLGCHGTRGSGQVQNQDLVQAEDASPLDSGAPADAIASHDSNTPSIDMIADSDAPPADREAPPPDLNVPPPDDGFAQPDPFPGDPAPSDPGLDPPTPMDAIVEIPSDPGSDPPPPPNDPIFRANSLSIAAPEICLPGSGVECIVTTPMVNQYLAALLNDLSDPVNWLFQFVPFRIEDPTTDLWTGTGACSFAGSEPLECGFSFADPPVVFEGPLWQSDCDAWGVCFETPEKPKFEAWFLGLFIAMHQSRIRGVVGIPGTPEARRLQGTIEGYVPVNTTKSLEIQIPGLPPVTLYELVQQNPVVIVNGIKTFYFQLNFEAQAASGPPQ